MAVLDNRTVVVLHRMSAATAQKERAHFVAGIQMEVAEMANDAQLVIEKG